MTKAQRLRKHLTGLYGHLYSRMEGVSLDECWYCGDVRQALDHCPPISKFEHHCVNRFLDWGGKLLLIPVCTECNSRLSNKLLETPSQRIAYLHQVYSKLIDKFYSDWDSDEIKQLGPYLKRIVMQKQKVVKGWIDKQRAIEARLLTIEDDAPKPRRYAKPGPHGVQANLFDEKALPVDFPAPPSA